MPFRWTLNPYTGCAHRCTFCYVRAFEQRAERPWDEAYGARVRVRTGLPDLLARALRRLRDEPGAIAVGAATDPYQPVEGARRLTRACLEVLAAHARPFQLITRGPLVVRDRDVLAAAAQRARVSISVSVPTLDPALHRATEPGVVSPAARLRAVRRLADAGLDAGVAIAPVIPGLTDAPGAIAAVVRAARAHGASHLWANLLYLRPGTREHFLGTLAREWPAEAERLAALYAAHAHRPRADERALREQVRGLASEHPRSAGAPLIVPRAPAPRDPVQLGLALEG